jgi:hypothetical protein
MFSFRQFLDSLPSTEALKNIATALGIALGGAWTLYRFGLTREREAKLGIDLFYTSFPYNKGSCIVSFDVILTNQGSTKLRAKRKRSPAFKDKGERLEYSCSLLLRDVPTDLEPNTQVPWFFPKGKSPFPGDLEFDLIYEYEIGDKTDFWLEPGEKYHVGTAVILKKGSFLVLVTFVGDATDDDFWRRTFVIQVPKKAVPDQPIDDPKEAGHT